MNFSLYRLTGMTIGSVLFWFALVGTASADETAVIETVRPFIAQARQEFDQIPAERQKELKKAAAFIRTKLRAGEPAKLTFICSHNSRRSHMAQIWALTAAAYYGIDGVEAYSGGTEATAFNIRTVRALRRAGLSLADSTGGKNPLYLVQYAETRPPVRAFSKIYNADGNPTEKYAAIMTCAQADKNCPIVEGSTFRVAVPYEDPKAADDKPEEAKVYDERNRQIAREMFFLMSQAKI